LLQVLLVAVQAIASISELTCPILLTCLLAAFLEYSFIPDVFRTIGFDVVADPTQTAAGGPLEPVGLTAPIVSQDFLTLSWRQPENPGLSDILGYVVQWNEAGSSR